VNATFKSSRGADLSGRAWIGASLRLGLQANPSAVKGLNFLAGALHYIGVIELDDGQ